MAKRKETLARRAGDVSPTEYDWRSQFAQLDPCDGYVQMDAGKVHGLAVALNEALARLAEAEALLREAQHPALADRIDAFLARENERE